MKNELDPKLIVLTGFTAGGKTTLKERLIERGYFSVVSFTTRELRENETDGVDYHHIEEKIFQKMRNDGQLFAVNKYGKNWYGTCKKDVALARRINAVWCLDVKAAAQVDQIIEGALNDDGENIVSKMMVVLVGPEDRSILEQRYLSRERANGKPEEDIRDNFKVRYERDIKHFPKLLARIEQNPLTFRRLPPGTKEGEAKCLIEMVNN